MYSNHAFRRTAATWLANQGVSLSNMKRFGRWKSSTVAERYIDESMSNKRARSQSIQSAQTESVEEETVVSEHTSSTGEKQSVTCVQRAHRLVSSDSAAASTIFAATIPAVGFGTLFGSDSTFNNCNITFNMNHSPGA